MAKKPKISVEIEQEEYDLYRQWAEKSGITLSQFVRKALRESIPLAEMRKLVGHDVSPVIDAAFKHLESEERVQTAVASMSTTVSPAVAPSVPPVTPPVTSDKNAKHHLHMLHPCSYLKVTMPANYTAKDCQGTCGSPKQPGRACFWGAQAARSCHAFRPKKMAS